MTVARDTGVCTVVAGAMLLGWPLGPKTSCEIWEGFLMTIQIVTGDCREVLERFGNKEFDAACFSPPYGIGNESLFDVRWDFQFTGNFTEYARAISRVSKLVAINLTQRTRGPDCFTHLEDLVATMACLAMPLWDRWYVVKNTAMPARGERALSNVETVLLFGRGVKRRPGHTAIHVAGAPRQSNVGKVLGTSPYYIEIPRQVFGMYGWDRVLDPFSGTGTSMKAAQELGLDGTGIEIDPNIAQASRQSLAV
jgi:hypothetical protein